MSYVSKLSSVAGLIFAVYSMAYSQQLPEEKAGTSEDMDSLAAEVAKSQIRYDLFLWGLQETSSLAFSDSSINDEYAEMYRRSFDDDFFVLRKSMVKGSVGSVGLYHCYNILPMPPFEYILAVSPHGNVFPLESFGFQSFREMLRYLFGDLEKSDAAGVANLLSLIYAFPLDANVEVRHGDVKGSLVIRILNTDDDIRYVLNISVDGDLQSLTREDLSAVDCKK